MVKQKDHTASVTAFIIRAADKHRDEVMGLIAEAEAQGFDPSISSANRAIELVEQVYSLLDESAMAELSREERQRRNGEAIELIAVCDAQIGQTRILLKREDHG
jgi:hypothetical protein